MALGVVKLKDRALAFWLRLVYFSSASRFDLDLHTSGNFQCFWYTSRIYCFAGVANGVAKVLLSVLVRRVW